MTAEKGGSAAEKKPENDTWTLPEVPEPVEYLWDDMSKIGIKAMFIDDAKANNPKQKGVRLTIGQEVEKCVQYCKKQKESLSDKKAHVYDTLAKVLETLPLFRQDGIPYLFYDGAYQDETKGKTKHEQLQFIIKTCADLFNVKTSLETQKELVNQEINRHDPHEHTPLPARDLIPFANCYFSPTDGTMTARYPHWQHRDLRWCHDVRYNPTATAPLFNKALETALPDPIERSRLLDMMAHGLMQDKHGIYKICICVGEGGNGKSTLLRFYKNMLGFGRYKSTSLNQLENHFAAETLQDIHANVDSETQGIEISAGTIGLLRSLLSGDDKNLNIKNKRFQQFRIELTWIQACNEMPKIPDTTDSMNWRMELIDFKRNLRHGKPDEGETWLTKNELAEMETSPAEMSGVLNMLLPRIMRLRRSDDIECPTPIDIVAKAQSSSLDPVSEFILHEMETTYLAEDFPTVKHTYAAYVDFCKANHVSPLTIIQFGKELLTHDMHKEPRTINTVNDVYWLEHRLKRDEKSPQGQLE